MIYCLSSIFSCHNYSYSMFLLTMFDNVTFKYNAFCLQESKLLRTKSRKHGSSADNKNDVSLKPEVNYNKDIILSL